MTEETKELINCIRVNLRHNKCFGGIDEIGCKLLLDCITNLQQNYNKLQDDYQEQYTYEYNLRKQLQHDLDKANDIIEKDRQFYKCRMDEYAELKKENERLKGDLDLCEKVLDELTIERNDYKSRCKKASVILNNIYLLNNVTITNNAVIEIDKAINILQGSDENGN